ncbi:MAG: hypothetical protein PHV59_08305, partial [Victivallales bacterium]|nr:hypothetical protein [Victivallales bacterium]
ACWYVPENIYAMALALRKIGAWGMMGNTFGIKTMNAGTINILSLAYAWSPGSPPLDRLLYDPRHIFGRDCLRLPFPSDNFNAVLTPIDISQVAAKRMAADNWKDHGSWFGWGMESDLWMLKSGSQQLAGMDFLIPADKDGNGKCIILDNHNKEIKNIAIGQKANSIILLNAMETAKPVPSPRKVGEIVIHYQDGTVKTLPLNECRQVTDWRTEESRDTFGWWKRGNEELLNAKPAFFGYTRFGEEINVQAGEIINPWPEKEIASIDVKVTSTDPVFRLAILGVTACSIPEADSKK